jgi:hypothetical protein
MSQPYKLTLIDNYGNSRIPVYKGNIQHSDKLLEVFYAVKPIDSNEVYYLEYRVDAKMRGLKQYDVLFTTAYLELYSHKAIKIMQEICPDQIQVFDTVIECKDGVVDTYKAINILNAIDVSDPEKSKYKYFEDGHPFGYERGGCVIKKEPMEPIHIARDKRSSATILISATLKEAFEKAKIKGCDYWAGD